MEEQEYKNQNLEKELKNNYKVLQGCRETESSLIPFLQELESTKRELKEVSSCQFKLVYQAGKIIFGK